MFSGTTAEEHGNHLLWAEINVHMLLSARLRDKTVQRPLKDGWALLGNAKL